MSTTPLKLLLDPSMFLQAAISATNVESARAVKFSCNAEFFDRLEDLATSHELFISSTFMTLFLKITDEIKQARGRPGFHVPAYVLWRLFGVQVGLKGISPPPDQDPARYAAVCDLADPNMQAYIDIADRLRATFKGKKIKLYAFRANIGRGHQTAGPALIKAIDTSYKQALQVPAAKDSGECNPDVIEKIFEDMLDFVELEGAILCEGKQTFDLLQGAGVPTSIERRPNPDLIDRDRGFLKDKFKTLKARGFRYMISKLKLGKLLLIDLKDPLLA